MPFRYSITLILLFMLLALSRGFVLQHYGELSPFGVLHALAEGDGGGGGGGGGDGGGGGGGAGDGGGGGLDGPPAPTCALSANPASLAFGGGSSTLSWTTTTATGAAIDNGVGAVSPADSGSRTISVTATTNYTMTVSGPGGEGTCTAEIAVSSPPPVWTNYCTGANDVLHPWQIWAYDNSTPTNYLFVENGTIANGCVAPVVVEPIWTNYCTGGNDLNGNNWQIWAYDDSTPRNYKYIGTDPGCAPPPLVTPACALSASPSTVQVGSSLTLSWTTTSAAAFSIDHTIGSVAPVASGSKSVSPTLTTTYTGTATGAGGSVTCSTTVTVTPTPPPPPPVYGCMDPSATNYNPAATSQAGITCTYPHLPPPPPAPTCTLVASPTTIQTGSPSTLSWTTANAASFSINHTIGSVAPVASGSKSVSPTLTTTYTGTATGAGGSATCAATVTVTTKPPPPPPPSAPTCTLLASPVKVNRGDRASLTWTATNADTFSINQGIGSVSPAVGGSIMSLAINADTIFTGTVVSPTGGTATCTATVSVNTGGGGGGGPSCVLAVSPTSIVSGSSATLSWGGSGIQSVSIDNGVGATTTIPSSTSVSPTAVGSYTYTGVFTANTGQTLTCTAALSVTGGGGGGCTSNCGGGGGGGGGPPPPTITLAALPHVNAQPLAYLYLSQIPYTGLELGPVGTVLYWIALVGWALALAYLVLFGAVPFANRSIRSFVSRVSTALSTRAVSVAPPHPKPPEKNESLLPVPEPATPRGYSPYHGFKSFAHDGALSIDDIVKSLSRHHLPRTVEEKGEPAPRVEPIYERVEPVYENVEPIAADTGEAATAVAAPASVRDFAAALLEGDRAAVFAGLRGHVQGAGAPEQLLSSIVCLIDDAYRARIDGTTCDAGIVRLTARFSTPVLEKLVASLTTAIDSSYSTGVTGAKLALTRALAILGA
ncbi:hypothetical protein HY972_02765 [Candidatus Kaiserbacteria bacterium]|nr:hypothetical protein [Candidatus Kaiserbacteria bacterium]